MTTIYCKFAMCQKRCWKFSNIILFNSHKYSSKDLRNFLSPYNNVVQMFSNMKCILIILNYLKEL